MNVHGEIIKEKIEKEFINNGENTMRGGRRKTPIGYIKHTNEENLMSQIIGKKERSMGKSQEQK